MFKSEVLFVFWFLYLQIITSANDEIVEYGVPITLHVDQDPWEILETLPIGSIIKTIKPDTRFAHKTEYRMEITHNVKPFILPFWIDPNDGYVYLNESLHGRGDEAFTINVSGFNNWGGMGYTVDVHIVKDD